MKMHFLICINNALNNKHIQGQQCECPQLQNNSLSRLKTMNYLEIHNIIICASPTTTIIIRKKKYFFL